MEELCALPDVQTVQEIEMRLEVLDLRRNDALWKWQKKDTFNVLKIQPKNPTYIVPPALHINLVILNQIVQFFIKWLNI